MGAFFHSISGYSCADRFRAVCLRSQCFNNTLHILLAESVRRIFIHAFCPSPFIGVEVLVSNRVNIWPEQVAIKPCEYFIMVFL